MTPVFCCGFECGVEGHINIGGNATFNTSIVRGGQRSLRCNPTAATATMIVVASPISGNRHIGKFYIWFATLPSADTSIARFGDSDATAPNIRFKQADSKLYAAVGTTFGASGISVTTGIWYRIDYDFNVNTGGADFCDGQVDGVALAQATATGTSTGAGTDQIGIGTTCNADIYIDDLIWSGTAADYPIGAGKVLSFVPAADGTHTFTSTHAILGTTGAPTTGSNITSATTNAFSFVNARPIGGGATDATRLWNQATLLSTEYAEVTIEQTTEVNPPRAVEVICIAREASSTTCNSTFKVNDNGTENTVYAMTVPVGNSDEFKSKQYATMVGGGAWTLARFKGLRLRWGYSSDATPDVYCRGWMIEAEFPESLDASAFGDRPMGQVGQGMMNQLLAQ